MRALEALEQVGYAVALDGDRIRVKYQGEGKPDPSTVKPLMNSLRESKPEAIRVLRDRETSRIFREALHELSDAWIPGLLEHTRKHHADIADLIREADEALERVWVRTLEGTMTMGDFEETVRAWKDAYGLTIEEHRARGCDECEPSKAGKCADFWTRREGAERDPT